MKEECEVYLGPQVWGTGDKRPGKRYAKDILSVRGLHIENMSKITLVILA